MVQQYPGCSGSLRDFEALTAEAHAKGALVTVAADLLALTLLKPPGEWGADVVVGSSQRFGVPLWYGGPHAAFMAVKGGLERDLPGRLVGLSIDAEDRPGLPARPADARAAHPPRRRRRPTSAPPRCCWPWWPPCTPCTTVPRDCEASPAASTGAPSTWRPGSSSPGSAWCTGSSSTPWSSRHRGRAAAIVEEARGARRAPAPRRRGPCRDLVRRDDHGGPLAAVLGAFGAHERGSARRQRPARGPPAPGADSGPPGLLRAPLRDGDAALPAPPVRPGLRPRPRHDPAGVVHHEVERDDGDGAGRPARVRRHPSLSHRWRARPATCRSIDELEEWLAQVTGYAKVSVQPNAGSQGELAGLLAIAAYHRSQGAHERDVCLIPSSAHGTNAASAVMAGMRVVVVASLERRHGRPRGPAWASARSTASGWPPSW